MALSHLQVAKTNATDLGSNKELLKILRMYPKFDPKNSKKHTARAFAFNDSLQILDRQIRGKFTRIEYETDEVVAENQLLEQQKQLYAGIAAALLLLSFSAFIILRQRIKNQKLRFEEQQQASNQEIFNLLLAQNEKVEEGKKSEQKRVSEELHDGVLGRMLGARMMLLGLNKNTDPHAMAERGKAISMLQDVEGEVRSISHELSHAAYQKIHNFILSIKDLLQNVENSTKIKIEFIFADDLDYDALTGEIKINLYRIIQECVQNAFKHAACDHIKISFDADLETLRIVIADDGKGFVVKKGKKGIGTRNITSRVKKVNGTWQLDSIIGDGTKVNVQIPIVSYDNSNNIRIAQEDLQEF
jgi:signal transduction histidine kinase